MKKALSLSLAAMAAVLLVGCGNKAAKESSSREESSRRESKLEASRSKSHSESLASSRKEASESRERARSESREDGEDGEDGVITEDQVAGLGQEYFITLDGKKYFAITIDSVSNKLTGKAAAAQKDKNSNIGKLYTDGKPQNALEIKWTYKNYSKDDGWRPDPSNFTIYDDKGTKLKNPLLKDNIVTLTKGKSAQATSWFVLPKSYASTKYIRIQYLAMDEETLDFKIPLH